MRPRRGKCCPQDEQGKVRNSIAEYGSGDTPPVISTKCGVAARMEKSISKAIIRNRFLHSLSLGRNDIFTG